MYKKFIKQILDFILSLAGFIALSPVFIIVCLLLAIANSGKPFFFQRRPGKNEKVFRVIKFKTMNDKTDKNGNLLSDAERLTEIGKFIRKTSLDETPQLINVIKGDMSLVGPRPLLEKYLPFYTEEEKKRHKVKPGITGLAQITGRNNLEWNERLKLDVEYSERVSFKLDVRIILKTIKNVLLGKDIAVDTDQVEMDFDEYRKKQHGNNL